MIIWQTEDVSDNRATLDDDMILEVCHGTDVGRVELDQRAIDKLAEQLDDQTSAAVARATRADRLANAALHLRTVGVEFSVSDLLDIVDYLEGRR